MEPLKLSPILYRKIKRIIREPGTVLFVGSGISAWSGLPNWSGLIEELASAVDHANSNGDVVRGESNLLIAAGLAVTALGQNKFYQVLKNAFKFGEAKPSAIHDAIISLGMTCYITTNYDDLLEQTLQEHSLLGEYRVISNHRSVECMKLMQFNANHFIFKPHGNLKNADSIVLSNEQYNRLYESGDKEYVCRTLESLLLSRKILFIGYGLKDPDFLYILSKIKNLYASKPEDLYAILPDVTDMQRTYWYENYGIQIYSYATEKTSNWMAHRSLLCLLHDLAPKRNRTESMPAKAPANRITPSQKGKLRLYANYLIQKYAFSGQVIPLLAQRKNYDSYEIDVPVERLQSQAEMSFLLIGNPGAGKSFFLNQYCLKCAQILYTWCNGETKGKSPKIPVFIDLKNYSGAGSIRMLIQKEFPHGLPFERWSDEGRFLFLFDSFNEIDLQYLDKGICERELQEYRYSSNCMVVTSRTTSHMEDFHLTEYRLEEIDTSYVEEQLEKSRYPQEWIQSPEFIRQLQVPLFFQLFVNDKLPLSGDARPVYLYNAYFNYLNKAFLKQYGVPADFIKLFQHFAYDLFDIGAEAFQLEQAEDMLRNCFPAQKESTIESILDWLTANQNFWVPTSTDKLAFFHEGITEFLAASYFAQLYRTNSSILHQKSKHQKWDYLIAYAASFLNENETTAYVNLLLQVDSFLAIRTCGCLIYDSSEATAQVLSYLIENISNKDFDYWVGLADEYFALLPLAKSHLSQLRELATSNKDLPGGAAAAGLLRVLGTDAKNELLEEMFRYPLISDFYNYCTRISNTLSSFITLDDFKYIINRLGTYDGPMEDKEIVLNGFDILARYLSLDEVCAAFSEIELPTLVQKKLFADILQEDDSQQAFELCLDLIKQGWVSAIVPAYLKASYNGKPLTFETVDANFLPKLVEAINTNECKWAIGLIYRLYQKSSVFAKAVRADLKGSDGIQRLAYLFAIGKNRTQSFIHTYRSMLYWKKLPQEAIGAFDDFDWEKHSDDLEHIIDFLTRDVRIDDLLVFLDGNLKDWGDGCSISLQSGIKLSQIILNAKNDSKLCNDPLHLQYVIGKTIAFHIDKDDLVELYHIINQELKTFFHYFVLNRVEGLEWNDFGPSEQRQLLEELHSIDYEEDISYNHDLLLANLATEEFAEKYLVPLLHIDNDITRANAEKIMQTMSRNQEIRFINR